MIPKIFINELVPSTMKTESNKTAGSLWRKHSKRIKRTDKFLMDVDSFHRAIDEFKTQFDNTEDELIAKFSVLAAEAIKMNPEQKPTEKWGGDPLNTSINASSSNRKASLQEVLERYSPTVPKDFWRDKIISAMEEYAAEQCSDLAAEYLNDSREDVREKEWIRDLYMLTCDLISNADLDANDTGFECLKKAHNYLVVEKFI